MRDDVINRMVAENGPVSAMLVARVPVLLLDISRGGCLIESMRAYEPGTIATLDLVLGSRGYREDVRIVRCTAVAGRGSAYRIGAEFLRTERVLDESLRHAVRRATTLVVNRPIAGEPVTATMDGL